MLVEIQSEVQRYNDSDADELIFLNIDKEEKVY